MRKCFVLMEADDVTLLQRWMADWCDLAEFEILPVVTGKQTYDGLVASGL